jgi:hypothetical protein
MINLFTLAFEALLYYFSVGFCAVWKDWAHNLLIIWGLALITDFLVMEFCLELFILIVYSMRGCGYFLDDFYKFLIAVKNLRVFC